MRADEPRGRGGCRASGRCRTLAAALAAAALACTSAQPLQAANAVAPGGPTRGPGGFPVKPVRVVVANAAGGTPDIVARVLGPRIGEDIGQPVLIDNRPGAAGLIARDVVARSPGDGYTLLLTNQTIVFAAAMQPGSTSDITRDFIAIASLGTTTSVLVAHPSVPARNFTELAALLKTRSVDYGSGGVGSSTHVAMELLLRSAGVKAVNVPYKSAAPALADVVAGHVQFMVATLPSALPYLRAGKLRALAATGAQRPLALKDLPTLAESGLPGYRYDTWYGLFGPAAMPAPLATWFNGVVNRALADAAVRERLAEAGLEPLAGDTASFQKLFREDAARWTRAIREAGIRAE